MIELSFSRNALTGPVPSEVSCYVLHADFSYIMTAIASLKSSVLTPIICRSSFDIMMRRLRQRYFQVEHIKDKLYSRMLYISPKGSHPVPRATDLIWILPKQGPLNENILISLMKISVSKSNSLGKLIQCPSLNVATG